MVAALGDFDVGRGFGGGEEARGGFVVEVGGQQMGCALPVVAAEAALAFAVIAFAAGGAFVRAGEGLLAGAGFCCGAVEDGEERWWGWFSGEAGGFEYRLELAGADYGVDFRDALADLVAVALDEAAGDDEFSCRAGGLVAGHFEDGVDRLLLGRVDKAARVDDEDLGLFGMGGEPRAGSVEHAHHHLGVDEVFGAAQRNKAHGGRRGGGKFAHFSIVLGMRTLALTLEPLAGRSFRVPRWRRSDSSSLFLPFQNRRT